MGRFFFYFFTVFSLFVISCNKNKSNTDNLGSSGYLSKIQSDIGFTTLIYNDYNVFIKSKWKDNSGDSSSILFEYNFSSKLIKSTEIIDNEEISRQNYIWYKDSIIQTFEFEDENGDWVDYLNPSYHFKTIYRLNEYGNVIKKERFKELNNNWDLINYYIYEWDNDNIVKSEFWNYEELNYTNIYEYDKKNNPYLVYGIFTDIVKGMCENNMIKRTFKNEISATSKNYNFEFEYNEINYPIKVISFYTNTVGETVEEEINFEYL